MDKFFGVFKSRRFYVAVGAVVVVILQDALGLDEMTAQNLVSVAIAWIVGDSINKTQTWTTPRK